MFSTSLYNSMSFIVLDAFVLLRSKRCKIGAQLSYSQPTWSPKTESRIGVSTQTYWRELSLFLVLCRQRAIEVKKNPWTSKRLGLESKPTERRATCSLARTVRESWCVDGSEVIVRNAHYECSRCMTASSGPSTRALQITVGKWRGVFWLNCSSLAAAA